MSKNIDAINKITSMSWWIHDGKITRIMSDLPVDPVFRLTRFPLDGGLNFYLKNDFIY